MAGTTGMAGTMGMAGTTGMAGSMGTGGSTGTGGTGGAMVDPRCVPLDGIVSWWHADGDFDDAVGSNDGTNGGAVSFVSGEDNQAFSMSGGSGSFVDVGNDASMMMTNAITLDAWINQATLGGRVIDKASANDGYMIDIVAGRLRMFINGTDQVLSGDVPAGMWVHVAGVFNGTGLGVYINGVLSAENDALNSSAIIANTNDVKIGDGGNVFVGMIDEPRIWNRALSADEINQLFWQGQNCH